MDHIELNNGFELIEADIKEFAKYYVIYKLERRNMWFPASMQNAIDLYVNFFSKNTYWIYLNGNRVGGVRIEPNWFGLVFLISPYQDELPLLNQVLKYVISISDHSKPITAFGVHEMSLENFQKFGFQIEEIEKTMICATSSHKITWDNEIYCDIPKKEELTEMANLYYEVFSKSNVSSLARKPHEFYENLLKGQMDEILPEYSTILHDKKTKEIIGICTAQIWFGMPSILDILIKPSYQKRGLGEMMIKKVLNVANENNYPAVALGVVPGNSAEYLYHKIGFISGVLSYNLKLELN